MNGKYKGIGRKSVAGLLLCLIGVLTACEDDFGKSGPNSGVLTMKVEVPEGWTSGVAVDEEAPDSRCVSVDAASSESSIPLYLHTIESDNTVAVPSTRGALKTTVDKFSMSAICYEEEKDIPNLTPNFAYDLTCAVTVGSDGVGTASCSEYLQWPANGKVRFFAFALPKDSPKPFTLSDDKETGAPTITYTVPENIIEQHDLMAACTDATSATVKLNFRHILTAVKVVTAKDMIPGTITEVTFSGIPNKGTYTPAPTSSNDLVAQGTWTVGTSTADYTVKPGVTIDDGYKETDNKETDNEDIVGTGKGGKEVIGATGDLTLLMIPQTLPDGATLEVKFQEALSGQVFTLSANLKGKKWSAGQIVTYSISPSSIHIKPVVEFNKKPGVEEDMLPYSGVWHDVEVRAYAEVTKDKEVKKVEEQIPEILYSFDGGNSYSSGHFYDSNGINELIPAASTESSNVGTESEIADGMCVLQAQEDFKALQGTLNGEFDSNNVINLYEKSGNESANCYMLDKPGYYKFPAVYGNTYKNGSFNPTAITIVDAESKNGMSYYPDYNGSPISNSNYIISKGNDAVLAWQDAPDLIDKVELISGGAGGPAWVKFRVRKHSITQGNALIVVRDIDKNIVWSWHIWVSQHTQAWRAKESENAWAEVATIVKNGSSYEKTEKKYKLTKVNLGYCDPHGGNPERPFKIKFKVKVKDLTIDVTKYKYIDGESDAGPIDCTSTTFEQHEFKGSLAGDNTYYQWGRSAPTPGGIYNSSTPMYYYNKKGTATLEYSELNMENKPLFYDKGEKSYGLISSVEFAKDNSIEGERGMTIPWAIQHPYVFIMSQYEDGNNDRDHWHEKITKPKTAYAVSETSSLFQMWNPEATMDGSDKGSVAKSVYDPCPAGYLVPPADLFSAFAYSGSYGYHKKYSGPTSANYTTSISDDFSDIKRMWTINVNNNNTFDFPATGVRNKRLRTNELGGNIKSFEIKRADESAISGFLREKTYPAFRMLTYVSSSTMGSDHQVLIFYIDDRHNNGVSIKTTTSECMTKHSECPAIGSNNKSSDSYGLSVRPMREP